MALRNQPYIPVYVNDVLSDERLIECSASAHGVYFRLLLLLHKSQQYGKLLLKEKYKQKTNMSLNFAFYLEKLLPFDLITIQKSLDELLENQIVQIEDNFLVQKRMVKDNELSEIRAAAGKKGGSSTGKKISNFAKSKTESNTETETAIENANAIVTVDKNDKPKKRLNLDKYGQYMNVLLTPEEHDNLCAKYGVDKTNDAIEYLSKYGEEKPKQFKQYKNHNLTLQRWVFDAIGVDGGTKKSVVESRNNKLHEFNSQL